MTRVAVIGSSGQLGSELVSVLRRTGSYEVITLSHADVEVTDADSVRQALNSARAEVVVNSAAYVRVDEAEDHPEQALQVNTMGALYVARASRAVDALCVYISSDYVFDGRKGAPYTEEDVPRPINVYGMSKLAGELLVQQAAGDWLIVRSASLFGQTRSRGKGGNFVETILAKAQLGGPISVVHDVRMSPTYSLDLARGIERLLRGRMKGVIHITNAGSATWCEFARAAIDAVGLKVELQPVTSQEYPTKARRPADSRLSSVMRQPELPRWQDALREYLAKQGYRLVSGRR